MGKLKTEYGKANEIARELIRLPELLDYDGAKIAEMFGVQLKTAQSAIARYNRFKKSEFDNYTKFLKHTSQKAEVMTQRDIEEAQRIVSEYEKHNTLPMPTEVVYAKGFLSKV